MSNGGTCVLVHKFISSTKSERQGRRKKKKKGRRKYELREDKKKEKKRRTEKTRRKGTTRQNTEHIDEKDNSLHGCFSFSTSFSYAPMQKDSKYSLISLLAQFAHVETKRI
jgi:hypothetical protein